VWNAADEVNTTVNGFLYSIKCPLVSNDAFDRECNYLNVGDI
jgi:hypothetical protein